MQIQVHQIIPVTEVEGPGVRFCIQVQGCPIKCPGCGVPQTWSTRAGTTYQTQELIDQIINTPNIEGVTFLGGEPFAQARALSQIAQALKQRGLSVVTFSGYLLEDLLAKNDPDYLALLSFTDLLIDGPFERENLDFSRPWIGSKNQRFHFLTDRYADLKHTLNKHPNQLEVRIKPDGRLFINGMASPHLLNALIKED